MVLDAERAFLHEDALTDTYVKPPHLRDTERSRLLKNACMAQFLKQPSIATPTFRKMGQTLACSAQANVLAQVADTQLSQKPHEKLELVHVKPDWDLATTVKRRKLTRDRS